MGNRLPAAFAAFAALFISLHGAEGFAAEGRTAGQFVVSPTGSAQYSIPIWTPPGPRGIQPTLSLAYDSRSGIGPLGIGWSIAGLGYVTRCNKTYAQDTTPAAVALATSDGYCLNGNRLRLTAGTYGAAGSTYQTEIADFSNVTANGTAGNGPASFTVQGRDGRTYEYGSTDGANSQVIATGTTTADLWLLSKVIDRAGNSLVINYTALTGTAVPNDILWTPTSAGASTYVYKMLFNYTTNLPASSLTKYIGGTSVVNNQLLSSIEIYSGSTVVKDYFLTYQASPTTGRDELITIKECADSGGSNCLLPTSVSYQNGTEGVSSTLSTALSSSGPDLTARYDLNGDGYPDLIYASGATVYVSFGSASGYRTPVNTGINSTFLVGNLTGGTEDGILANNGGTWWYYKWNGSSFAGTSTGLAYDSTAAQYQLADVNGDGLPDLVSLYVTYNSGLAKYVATVDTRLNTGRGGPVTFNSTLTAAYTNSGGLYGVAAAQLQTPDMQYGKLRRYDFDGDGRDDLALMVVSGKPGNNIVTTYELLSTGAAFNATSIQSLSGTAYIPVFFTNWNDDACTDFVTGTNLYISGCNGTVPATFAFSQAIVGAVDWNGDGRTDLLVANGSTIGVYLSTGGAPGSMLPTSIPYSSTCQYVTMDTDGDGLDDLGCWSQTGANSLTYRMHMGAGQPPDLASTIKDGYGNSASPTYVSIVQSDYQHYSDAVFPYHDYIGPLYVVNEAVFSDPSNMPSGTYNQQYYYYGAWTNLQGRDFQSFYTKRMIDGRNGLYYFQYYERSFPYSEMDFEDVLSNSSGAHINVSTRTPAMKTLDGTANNERYFPYFSNVTSTQQELDGSENGDLTTTSSTDYTFDNYGNATALATTVTDNDPGSPYVNDTWTSTIVNTIAPNTSTWCLGLPTETQVTNSSTSPGGAAITRTVTYTPDYTNCRETGKVTEPSSSTYKVTEAYTFDSFGNLWTSTVTGIGMAARVATTTWGTTGQFPTVLTNPLSQSVTRGYDPNSGRLTSQTDPNWTPTNPIATTWGYDPFQRKTSELRPDGTSTTWGYNSCATNGCVNSNNKTTVTRTVVNVGGTTQSVTNTYLDSVDRTLVTSSTMLNGAYDRNEVQYDNLGRVHQQGAPCAFVSCTNYWTISTYDVLNRLTQSQRPISATNSTLQTSTIQYAGRTTTVTDAQGKNTTKINLVTGSLARTQDHNGYYVNFKFDAFGSALSVTDSLSNTLNTMTYDYGLQAFQRTSSDTDLGARSSTYDALGEVTAYADAKGQNFSALYDALSRPTSRTEPDLTTTWTWGNSASSFNIGKLQSVAAASSAGTYSEAYGYDSKTRLSTKTVTIPGDTAYTYTDTYNATTGLLDTLQYPVSTSAYQLKLQYTYGNGILKEISDATAGTQYWLANTVNPRGQITQETLGNGVVANHSFDAVTGWVGSVQAGPGGGAALQNNSYVFDEVGNLTQRQDNARGLTENIYYDNLYRLDHSTLNGTTNLSMTYDAMGDIATAQAPGSTIVDTRNYTAQQTGCTYYANPQLHAVRSDTHSTTITSFCYDANGNTTAVKVNGLPYGASTWTSYNQPSGISGGASSSTFFYDANHQRYKQIASYGGVQETTIYVGGLLEKVMTSAGTAYRHYIPAGNNTALYIRGSTGSNLTYYMTKDHFGSSSVLTNATGALVVNESFSAWGSRRGSDWGSDGPTTTDMTQIGNTTRHGFTGQEMLDNLNFVNMNGRIYGETGTFLSPDPNITNPGDTQNYNRYSYVQNRPLTLTDPTGFATCNRSPSYCGPNIITYPCGSGTCHILSNGFKCGLWRCPPEFSSPKGGGAWIFGGGDDFFDPGPLADPGTSFAIAASAVVTNATTTNLDSQTAQGTISSLDYIGITANYLYYDANTGTVLTIPAGGSLSGTGGLSTYVPFANSAAIDPDRAYQAILQSDAANASGDPGEAARQMDIYYQYCGCSSGPAYNNMTFPPPPLSPMPPTIAPPALPTISPPSLPNIGP